jgi:SAM-dependent methyltransferase
VSAGAFETLVTQAGLTIQRQDRYLLRPEYRFGHGIPGSRVSFLASVTIMRDVTPKGAHTRRATRSLAVQLISRFPKSVTFAVAIARRLLPYHLVARVNALMLGSSQSLWGSDHRSGRWETTIRRLAEFTDGDVDVRSKQCLELGTGNCTDIAYFFLLCGAEYVTTLDIARLVNYNVELDAEYEQLRRQVADNQSWLSAFTGGQEAPTGVLSMRVAARLGYYLYDGLRIPAKDQSVGFLWSNAVLEHVRDPQLLLFECARVLKRGAMMVHTIDLRDHFHLDPRAAGESGVWGDWLDCLRFGNASWRIMGAPVNRLRWPQWRRLLLDTGFAIDKQELRRLPLHSTFDRRRILEEYRNTPEEDLTVAAALILATKR